MLSLRRQFSRRICLLVLFVLCTSLFSPIHGLASKNIRIQVCQNKDCCQRYQGKAQNLVETIQCLSWPKHELQVESSSCLSQCGKGPNIMIHNHNGEELYFGNVVDPASAGAVLEMATTDIAIHPTLLAAANVMERAHKVTSLEEKKRFLSSVVSALENKDEFKESVAMARAHAMRAKVLLKMNVLDEAISDAQRAVQLDPNYDKAWRALAEVQEAAGDLTGAIDTLRSWSKACPSFTTKVNKEIQRLRSEAS